MDWIKKHIEVIICSLMLLTAIDFGIYAWRMPKQFRSGVLPKVEAIAGFERRVNERMYKQDKLIAEQELRINLLLEIERRRSCIKR